MTQTTTRSDSAAAIGADRRHRPRCSPTTRYGRSCTSSWPRADLDGRSVCVLVPDGTRSCPMPLLLGAVHEALHGRVSRLTVLVALGTHSRMGETELSRHLGYPAGRVRRALSRRDGAQPRVVGPAHVRLGRHDRRRPASPSCPRAASHQSVEVRLNRAVVEHDVTLVVGPVFPHEVVGFSGGNKYFFPGVSSQEVINVSHWLGALITSAEIIGTRGITPVRALIDEAVSLVPGDKLAFCVVVKSGSTGAALGGLRRAGGRLGRGRRRRRGDPRPLPRRARSAGCCRSSRRMYHDIWTAAKGFYKVEPVVADGGAGRALRPARAGGLLHPPGDRRDRLPLPGLLREAVGPLPRSSRGGCSRTPPTCAAPARTTRPPARSATGSPSPWPPASRRTRVRAVNLDYLDPAEVDAEAWAADPDTLVVPHAGEDLFRLR